MCPVKWNGEGGREGKNRLAQLFDKRLHDLVVVVCHDMYFMYTRAPKGSLSPLRISLIFMAYVFYDHTGCCMRCSASFWWFLVVFLAVFCVFHVLFFLLWFCLPSGSVFLRDILVLLMHFPLLVLFWGVSLLRSSVYSFPSHVLLVRVPFSGLILRLMRWFSWLPGVPDF